MNVFFFSFFHPPHQQIVQPFDNLALIRSSHEQPQFVVPASPIVQLPQTPQIYLPTGHQSQQFSTTQQQQQPSPLQQHHQSQQDAAAAASSSGRRQVARGLQYKDNVAYEQQRGQSTAVTGLTVDSFQLLSVLGRGHFGKVILSQYKNTGEEIWR